MTNPYAPPGQDDGGFLPPHAVGALGPPQPWQVGEVCRIGWEVIKREPLLIVAQLIVFVIPQTLGSLASIPVAFGILEAGSLPVLGLQLTFSLISVFLAWFLQVGMVRMLLAAVREQPMPLTLLFSGGDRFLTMFGAMFLTGLAVGVGTLLLVVPGVIAYLGLWLGKFYVVDRQQGAVESLQASWRDTDGNRGDLFVFALAYFGLVLAGVCMCGLGMLVTLPLAEAALTVIYLRRTGQASAPYPARVAY
ncbi:MAG TPA: hypothetical protein VI197_02975 [Polyangiaceae bacterium]